MPNDLIEFADITTPKLIKVIGVGGGGGNAVGQMYRDEIPDVRYVVTNTDSKALTDSPVPDRLQLGPVSEPEATLRRANTLPKKA